MSKTIKISAIVVPVLLLLGAFFKTSHYPGANVILAAGAVAGIVIFIWIVASGLRKNTTGFEQFNGIFASIAIIFGLLAFLFKMNHWPGAGTLIWLADIGISLSALFFLIDSFREKDPAKWIFKTITTYFIVILALVIFLAR